MGDSSFMAPDLQSLDDIQKSNALKENHETNVDEHHASNMEEENLSERPNSEGVHCLIKPPSQQNGYRAEVEECETGLERLKPQVESESAQVNMSSLDKNGSSSLSSHEDREDDSNGDKARGCSLPPTNLDGMQKVTMEGMNAQAPFNFLHEGPVVNHEGSNGVSMGDTMEDENAMSRNASNVNIMWRDKDDVPSKAVDDKGNDKESYLKEERDGLLTPPCMSTENNLEKDVQPSLFLSANESGQRENAVSNEPGADIETPSNTSNVLDIIQNEVNLRKGEWPDQGCGVKIVISNDMEGWQRFDAEEVDTAMDHTQGSYQSLPLWEKLLDDGLDGSERESLNPPLQLAIAPSPFEESKFGLASPGNPFMEGLERVSSFSEADGFAQNRDLPSSGRLSQSFEEPSSFQWGKGQILSVTHSADISSVLPTIDGETQTVQLASVNEHGSNRDLQLPSSRRPLSSFDAIEPFEAPSFMSLVDPKSHALFEASMPTFQASSTGYGHENGGEKWVANFDLMAPSTQEITRSLSMARSGGEASGQHPGQSFSFATSREQEPNQKESDSPQGHRTKSGFLSPKFSPIVQKVVDKVRTTPAVTNGVLKSVRQAVSPKTTDRKSSSKSLFTRCICW